MPSIATQTNWSWVLDLEEIGRLVKAHGGEDSHFSGLSLLATTGERGGARGKDEWFMIILY